MLADIEIPIVIVGFGNAADIVKCLTAVREQRGSPKIGVFICENGGAGAFDALIEALSSSGGPCAGEAETIEVDAPVFLRVRRLRLAGAGVPVFVAEASENLGFPGGVNSWIRLFLLERGWEGVWVLNPDTWPAPEALAELVRYADKRRKGMVQSRIMFADRSDITSSRGLKWHKFRAKQTGVDIFAPVSPAPDPDDIERRMDSPTGVSFYVTRACIDTIGLMDNSYWLYWEDFDWGVRAKAACGVGYAHDSVVPHIGGELVGRLRQTRQAFGRLCLSRQPQQAALRAPAPPTLVRMDRARVFPQNQRVPGGRIDAQLRRGGEGSCRWRT